MLNIIVDNYDFNFIISILNSSNIEKHGFDFIIINNIINYNKKVINYKNNIHYYHYNYFK